MSVRRERWVCAMGPGPGQVFANKRNTRAECFDSDEIPSCYTQGFPCWSSGSVGIVNPILFLLSFSPAPFYHPIFFFFFILLLLFFFHNFVRVLYSFLFLRISYIHVTYSTCYVFIIREKRTTFYICLISSRRLTSTIMFFNYINSRCASTTSYIQLKKK